MAKPTVKEEKGTHATVTCSRCNKTWEADDNPFDSPCVGLAHHDLHGNRELLNEGEE